MTVHYKGQCIHTKSIICDVPTETHRRMKQPYMVVRGWTEDICILEDAYDAAVVGEGGITVDDEGDVYVSDWRNDRIQKFGADGEFIFQFGVSDILSSSSK